MKTLFAILLLSLTGFAFADGHVVAEEGEHAEMAAPVEGEGELTSDESVEGEKKGTFLNLANDNTLHFDPPDEESDEGEQLDGQADGFVQ